MSSIYEHFLRRHVGACKNYCLSHSAVDSELLKKMIENQFGIIYLLESSR